MMQMINKESPKIKDKDIKANLSPKFRGLVEAHDIEKINPNYEIIIDIYKEHEAEFKSLYTHKDFENIVMERQTFMEDRKSKQEKKI